MKNEEIKILVVDDEVDIIEILRYNLSEVGYQVVSAVDGLEGFNQAEKHNPHLIILDVMMPNLDGISTCEKFRSDDRFKDTIIMFLTARGEDYSYVAAFDAGADDYITKPVKPKVLVSKVKGLLRRLKDKQEGGSNIIQFEDLIIDGESYKVSVDGNEINLPRKEFELLYLLASKPDKVFKRDKIMERVWGSEVVVGDRTIDVHIRKLRKKIGDQYFKTVKGVGYKFKQPKS
ncbi:MAG: response regulator transcription factor [Flavobacteriaceae bacterium]